MKKKKLEIVKLIGKVKRIGFNSEECEKVCDPKDEEEKLDYQRQKNYYLNKISVKDIEKGKGEPKFIVLIGKNNEKAWVQTGSPIRMNDGTTKYPVSLLLQYPLKYSVEKTEWYRLAFKFFKKRFISHAEVIFQGEEVSGSIKDGEYGEKEIKIEKKSKKQKKIKVKYKKYNMREGWGSESKHKEMLKKRNEEMRKLYKEMKLEGRNRKYISHEIQKWLKVQTVWPGRTTRWAGKKIDKELSEGAIWKICYSKK